MALERNKDISRYSAFKTPATTEYFFELASRSELGDFVAILQDIRKQNLPIVYIAGGTNCLFAFDHFPGIIVHLGMRDAHFIEEDNKLTLHADSGVLMSPVVIESIKTYGAKTLLPWVGLPGTIGGAVVGNAGCFWLETSSIVDLVEVLDTTTGEMSFYSNEEMKYEYRSSILKWQDRHLVISAVFNLQYTQTENPFTKMTIPEMQATRRTKQPPGMSCGSYFTNPSGTSAGKLIDQAGLKGAKIGGVQISEHHANFFVSSPGATWQDVLSLAELAKSKVYETFQIELHEEVRIIK